MNEFMNKQLDENESGKAWEEWSGLYNPLCLSVSLSASRSNRPSVGLSFTLCFFFLFLLFLASGCKLFRYYVKIANLRIKMTKLPKHTSEWKLAW